ncbi:MAG TPA: ribonuclease HI [Spirochaetia bacterium]|nr:ribonuclease HI [Spirochaetia bacterium]
MNEVMTLDTVDIYTDGACSGNPGPGGYGVVLKYGETVRELSGGFRLTTNNRMEIMAAIIGLATLKRPCRVTLYSDSRYLVDAMSKGWVRRWKANNWMRDKENRAKNVDLWQKLLQAASPHQVTWQWVRGHAANQSNNRCDQLATAAARLDHLPVDEGFGGA